MKMNIQNPYAPQAGDDELKRAIVYLDAVIWDDAEQTLTISGNLPNSCCQLRVEISQGDTDVSLDVYSLKSEEDICAQMLEPFEAQLIFENFSKEESSISVNGEIVDY